MQAKARAPRPASLDLSITYEKAIFIPSLPPTPSTPGHPHGPSPLRTFALPPSPPLTPCDFVDRSPQVAYLEAAAERRLSLSALESGKLSPRRYSFDHPQEPARWYRRSIPPPRRALLIVCLVTLTICVLDKSFKALMASHRQPRVRFAPGSYRVGQLPRSNIVRDETVEFRPPSTSSVFDYLDPEELAALVESARPSAPSEDAESIDDENTVTI